MQRMKSKDKATGSSQPSLGTKIAEAGRANANHLPEAERKRLLEKGMGLIYGANRNSEAPTRSR
jgi:hypothetical protein